MIQEVEKSPKVALCRACYGTGKVKKVVEYPSRIFGKKRSEAKPLRKSADSVKEVAG